MDKVYETGADQHVVATYVYAKTADAYAYSDAARTVKIKAADLKNLFFKGAIIADQSGTLYFPTHFDMESTVGVLTYVKNDGTTPTSALLATVKSEEFAG